MASKKTAVIEHLFKLYWDHENKTLRRSMMTLDDVAEAIRFCNRGRRPKLSDRNPANFIKDVIRGRGASRHWPDLLKKHRITAVQRTGNRNVFEFVPYGDQQSEPFEDTYQPRPETPTFRVQSLSMLDESKSLGRGDEPWLMQTVVNFRVIETHFALSSPVQLIDLIHLQMSLKLRRTEIDALFLGRRRNLNRVESIAITCEAKTASQRILENQLVEQTKAAFSQLQEIDLVVPIAIRAVTGRGIYVAEFAIVERRDAVSYEVPVLAAEAVYELKPPVSGISFQRKRGV